MRALVIAPNMLKTHTHTVVSRHTLWHSRCADALHAQHAHAAYGCICRTSSLLISIPSKPNPNRTVAGVAQALHRLLVASQAMAMFVWVIAVVFAAFAALIHSGVMAEPSVSRSPTSRAVNSLHKRFLCFVLAILLIRRPLSPEVSQCSSSQ